MLLHRTCMQPVAQTWRRRGLHTELMNCFSDSKEQANVELVGFGTSGQQRRMFGVIYTTSRTKHVYTTGSIKDQRLIFIQEDGGGAGIVCLDLNLGIVWLKRDEVQVERHTEDEEGR